MQDFFNSPSDGLSELFLVTRQLVSQFNTCAYSIIFHTNLNYGKLTRAGESWHVFTIIHRHTSRTSSVIYRPTVTTIDDVTDGDDEGIWRLKIQLRNKVTTELFFIASLLVYLASYGTWNWPPEKIDDEARKTINNVCLLLDEGKWNERDLKCESYELPTSSSAEADYEYVIANKWNFISSIRMSCVGHSRASFNISDLLKKMLLALN